MYASCYRKTDRGIVQIKELSTYHDVLKEMQSSSTLSTFNSLLVNAILNDANSVDEQIHDSQKSAIKEPANDIMYPCNNLPICDVVGQGTSRPSIAEIVDPKSPIKSTEARSSTSTLGATKQRQRYRLHCDRFDRCTHKSNRLI
jgi:hypothetical protein